MNWHNERELLLKARHEVEAGLTEAEFTEIEEAYGFRFPCDLRSFLSFALPVGKYFPNWRAGLNDALTNRFSRPEQGIIFDIEHNEFWMDEWGPRPSVVVDAIAVARAKIQAAPKLIPVFSHRYLPAEPNEAGNPVFSVHQTDIICYGSNLRTYLAVEFGRMPKPEAVANAREIRFWSQLTS